MERSRSESRSRRPSPARDSIQTLVAVKDGGEWLLTAFQNTRVREMSKSFSATLLWLFGDWIWKFVLPRDRVASRSFDVGSDRRGESAASVTRQALRSPSR